MARMRNLKPGFFTNEDLAALSPLARLLFAGLWTIADRDGRLEDRPKRIKAAVLPYDHCNVDALLSQLALGGFIVRYRVQCDSNGAPVLLQQDSSVATTPRNSHSGKSERVGDGATGAYIQIPNFLKHQTPHVNEAKSIIPAPYEHSAPPVLPPEGNGTSIPSHARAPELEPELELEPETTPNGVVAESEEPSAGDDQVDEVYAHFRARVQPKSRLCPRKKIAARLKHFSADELREGIDHFAEDPWWMEHNATQGAEWFFESDKRAEQFLLMKPRPTANVVPMNGQPKRPIDAPPEVPANSPFLKFREVS